jgi:hypothetical protein
LFVLFYILLYNYRLLYTAILTKPYTKRRTGTFAVTEHIVSKIYVGFQRRGCVLPLRRMSEQRGVTGFLCIWVGGGYIARSKSAIFRHLYPPSRTSAAGPMPNCKAKL